MSDTLVRHAPCPECGSKDNVAVYDDGHGHCFGCEAHWGPGSFGEDGAEIEPHEPTNIPDEGGFKPVPLTFAPLGKRGLSQETCRKYGYGLATFLGGGNEVAPHQFAPYHDDKGRLVAYKVRGPNKYFTFIGDASAATLFGQKHARPGGKMLTVTEGEVDALSVSQVFGNRWPAVSVPNGAAGAAKAFKKNLEFLESYDKVVICFDQDEPGEKAAEECAAVLSPGKAHIVSLPRKDANEMVAADEAAKLRDAIWGARPWRPDGVINLADIKAAIAQRPSMGVEYPWDGLNRMLYGQRPTELTTWTGGTGAGKSSIVSELVYNLGVIQGKKVGCVYLEESVARSGQRLVGLEMNKPIHLPGVDYTEEEFDAAFDRVLGTGRILAYDAFGTVDTDVLMSRLRYMTVGLGCEYLILDHIAMFASGSDVDADERRLIDRLMTELRSFSQETGACLHIVSHLRRIGQSKKDHEAGLVVGMSHLRGSQAIAQLSDTIIAAERDQQSEEESNITRLRVLKNRYAGTAGVACELEWDASTGRLAEVGGNEQAKEKLEDAY
jgi:twinkle protein